MVVFAQSDYLRLPNVGRSSRQIRSSCIVRFYLARDEPYDYKSEERRKSRKGDEHEPRFQEKVRSHVIWCSYRKPTQVDGERIPRRTGQCSFRNSAKKRPYLRYMACPFVCWVVRNCRASPRKRERSGRIIGLIWGASEASFGLKM